jgi:hypothetical protein
VKFTLYIPPPVYPPLPFAINVRPNCVVDLMGVQFYEDHVDTPVHPNVMTFQAERAYHEMWHALDWANLS